MIYDWRFEPCENEGPICDPISGDPYPHAVRGRKPARPMVMGYGHSEHDADTDARRKAQQQDAREVLGERGEVVIVQCDIVPSIMLMLGTNYAIIDSEIRWIGNPIAVHLVSFGSCWPSLDPAWLPMGT